VTARQDEGMTEVVATAERIVRAPAERTLAALADYEDVRPRLVTDKFLDYRVEAGGQGAGTRVAWRFAATKSRVREQVMTVTQPTENTLVETDENSTLVTMWTVHPTDAGLTTVRVRTSWQGAAGIGGFFERTFAPPGLRRVYDQMLERLDEIIGTG
jgi:Polyketide cyclase / dehydrase and lipid transport